MCGFFYFEEQKKVLAALGLVHLGNGFICWCRSDDRKQSISMNSADVSHESMYVVGSMTDCN